MFEKLRQFTLSHTVNVVHEGVALFESRRDVQSQTELVLVSLDHACHGMLYLQHAGKQVVKPVGSRFRTVSNDLLA